MSFIKLTDLDLAGAGAADGQERLGAREQVDRAGLKAAVIVVGDPHQGGVPVKGQIPPEVV